MRKISRLFLIGLPLLALGAVLYAENKDVALQPAAESKQQAEQERPASYWLGVRLMPVPDVLLSHFGAKDESKGLAFIEQVVPDSPAAKAGLKRGDVLLRFADKEIATLNDLVESVADAKDTEQTLSLIRDGKPLDVAVKAEPRPENTGNMRAIPLMQRFHGQPFERMVPMPEMPEGMKIGRDFFIGPRNPQDMMKEAEERFRQMQGENGFLPMPGAGMLMDSSSKRLEIRTKTDQDGKTSVQVKRYTKTGDDTVENTWEAENIEALPDEIREEVQKMLPTDKPAN